MFIQILFIQILSYCQACWCAPYKVSMNLSRPLHLTPLGLSIKKGSKASIFALTY